MVQYTTARIFLGWPFEERFKSYLRPRHWQLLLVPQTLPQTLPAPYRREFCYLEGK